MGTTPGLTLHAEVLLSIATLDILITADKTAPAADWIFSGTLAKPVLFDFEDGLNSLSLTLSLAYDLGFPRSLILETATATTNVSKGTFELAATSTFDWSFNFGVTQLKIKSLAIDIKIGEKPAQSTGKRKYSFKGSGIFTLAGLQTTLAYVTSTIAESDTILTAVVEPEQLNKLNVGSISDTLTTTSTSGAKWNTIAPNGYSIPTFKTAYFLFNLTQNIAYVYGSVTGFGDAALLIKKHTVADSSTSSSKTDTTSSTAPVVQWNYAFSLNLGNGFTFGAIFSSLASIDSILKVNNAGLFIVSYEGSTTSVIQDLKGIQSFSDKPASYGSSVSIPDLESVKLTKGMFIYADLDFNSSSLFKTLLEIGTEGTAKIQIYGAINKTDPTQTIFGANLPDITVLSTLTFTHTDAYPGIHLEYTPGNKKQFSLKARLKIGEIFGKNYAFDGELITNANKMSARLNLVTSASDDNKLVPFSIAGLEIKALYAEVNYTFAKPAKGNNSAIPATQTVSTFAIGGNFKLGPASAVQSGTDNRPDLNLTLNLENGKPVLAQATLNQDFGVGAFFAQFITGTGANWPSDFFEITFKSGSSLYYYNKAIDSNKVFEKLPGTQISRLSGLNMAAEITLHIMIDIPIKFTLQAIQNTSKQYTGVKITGSNLSSPINLYILEIASKTITNGMYTGAPVFTLDTTTSPGPTMGFESGFNFLQKPFGTADLKVRKLGNPAELTLTGTLSSTETFPIFGTLSLGFTYSKSKGFNVTGWPDFDYIKNAIDFVAKLKEIASADSGFCGKLEDFIASQTYTTKFSISPSFKTSGGKFYFVLNGNYRLSVLNKELFTVNFPDAVGFVLPNNLSMDNLPGEIYNALVGASESFVRALLNNPDAIASFLLIIGGKKAAQYAADLACQGLVDGAVTTAVGEGATALAAAGGIAAGGAAVAAATAAINGFHPGNHGGNHGSNKNPSKPDNVTLKYENNTVKASWGGMIYAAGYNAAFYDSAGKKLKSNDVPNWDRNYSLTITSAMTSADYTLKVASKRGPFTSDYTSNTISRLATPENLQLSVVLETRQIKATWSGSGSNYTVQLIQGAVQKASSEVSTTSYLFETTNLMPGEYQFQVIAENGSSHLPSLVSALSNHVYLLDKPNNVQISYNPANSNINVNWDTVVNNQGYLIQILNRTRQPGAADLTGLKDAVNVKVNLNNFTGGVGTYQAHVTAIGNSTILKSSVAVSSNSIARLNNVTGLSQTIDKANSKLNVQWAFVANAIQYEAKLYAQGNETPLNSWDTSQPISGNSPTPTTISTTVDVSSYFNKLGVSFIIKVAVKGTTAILAGIQASTTSAITQIPAPTTVQMTWATDKNEATVTWVGNDQAINYKIKVLSKETNAVVYSKVVGKTITPLVIPASDFSVPLNGNYLVDIQSLASETQFDSVAAPGISIAIIDLPTPELKPLVLQGGDTIVADLKALVPMADGYKAQLVTDGQPSGDIMSMKIVEGTGGNTTIPAQYQISFIEFNTTPNPTRGTKYKGETKYKVRIQAVKDGYPASEWALSSNSIQRINAATLNPVNIDPNYARVVIPNNLLVSLTAEVEGADSYTGQLFVQGLVSGQSCQMTKNQDGKYSFSFELTNDMAGKILNVNLITTASGYLSNSWSNMQTSPVTYYTPRVAPTDPVLTLGADGKSLFFTCKSIGAYHHFYFEIENAETNELLKCPPIQEYTPQDQPYKARFSNLTSNTSYRVRCAVMPPLRSGPMFPYSDYSNAVKIP